MMSGMDAQFFDGNRRNLTTRLQGGVVVLTAAAAQQQRSDMAYPFVQEANFWYLTGIEAAGWKLVIDGTRGKSWLVRPDISAVHELFDGSLSAEEAQQRSGASEVIGAAEFEPLLRELARRHSVVYTLSEEPHAEHYDFVVNPAPKELRRVLGRLFEDVRDCRDELSALRAIKQPVEIDAMTRAIKVTTDAFALVKERLGAMKYEYEVEAEFSYLFRRAGATGHAYTPIVAAGGNACILHYVKNTHPLHKRSLLLLDIGASVDGYAADITRTYALGSPTKRQQAVHAAVAQAHQDIVALLAPGLPVVDYHQAVDQRMKRALMDIGVLDSPDDEQTYRQYFPHAISHGLGIDVHDALGRPRVFQEGMVLTVEPGIYLSDEAIGVRIEDDILITADGARNLSQHLPIDL